MMQVQDLCSDTGEDLVLEGGCRGLPSYLALSSYLALMDGELKPDRAGVCAEPSELSVQKSVLRSLCSLTSSDR